MKRIITIMATLVLLLAVLIPMPVSAAEPVDGYYHYIGPWVWNTMIMGGSWQAPSGVFEVIDLRSIPEMSQKGGTPGLGFFISSTPITLQGYRLVGRRFVDEFPQAVRTLLQTRYGVSLPSAEIYTTRGLIWSLFVEMGDPTGEARWRPLVAEMDGTLVINLSGYSPVTFIKDTPRKSPGWGWRWKGKWERKWDFKYHKWVNHWQYFKQRAWR